MQRRAKFKHGLDVQTTNSLKFKQLVGVVSQYWNYNGTNCKAYCRYIAYLVVRILTTYMLHAQGMLTQDKHNEH